jgi:hypothetical protein
MQSLKHTIAISGFLFILFITVASFNPFFFGAYAQVNTTSNVTVNITISEVAEITVTPTNFTIAAISPGADSSEVTYSIKNTGSTTITNIFASTNTIEMENTNPIPGGDPEDYAASGFIWIQNVSAGAKYAHAGRLEWNLSSLESETLDLASTTTNWSRGWYRNGSNTWLWKVENGTAGDCNNTGSIFKIKEAPENDTSGFSRDFTSGIVTTGSFDEATVNWSLFNLGGTVLDDMCVATHKDCQKIFIYKYDKRYDAEVNFDGCDNSAYMRTAALEPSSTVAFYARASVPKGTPYGLTEESKLTLEAT